MFASCGQQPQKRSYQAVELGTPPPTAHLASNPNPKLQDHSVPKPICFVFKSSESTGGKQQKKKAGADKTAKARAEKAKTKTDPKKSKKDYVFEKDPNKTDVENFIDSIESFELLGTCNDNTCVETMVFKSIDFSKLVSYCFY